MRQELLKGEPAEKGDGLKEEDVGDMSDGGRNEGADAKISERIGVRAGTLEEMDALENVVIDKLAGQEADDAGDENAASIIGDGVESRVVGARVVRQKPDERDNCESEKTDTTTTPSDAVGGAAAVNFGQKVIEDVREREKQEPAVNRKITGTPKFDGAVIGDDEGHGHERGHNDEGGLGGRGRTMLEIVGGRGRFSQG